MTAAIQVQSVSKHYGSLVALDHVDLAIESGEFFGLLGPNGAGKTTLISIIAGLVRASSGKVAIMGHDVVEDFRAARLSVGVVPQELAFDPFFTVRETLRFQSGYFGLGDNGAWIDEVLENLGLAAKSDTNTRALSGGMKRRLLVAQALVHKPPVIVLDEPTAGVDVELRQTLWNFIRRLNREGHTIVLTTHYLEEAQALCGRIAMLKAGRIVALDTTRALLARIAGLQLTMRPGGTPPASVLARRIEERDGLLTLRLAHAGEVARVLADCAAAGCTVEDLEVGRADLEDVFLQLMSDRPPAAERERLTA
ncbi:MAG TPA: ABC transporter ATP-binding protein [Burkholderiaceae bacterium]|nr:ABC transporter ATP-binding protein [Burkholderiaceae bacterium]HQR70400.1 ABC transporter ATP-binding protein [Burkholderiaceae bacterium]